MKKLPLIPTIIVALAIAGMVALGLWQITRAEWKEGLLKQYAANLHSTPISFPPLAPVHDDVLFRRSSAHCLNVVGWRVEGAGESGFRLIAECRTGAEGPGLLAVMGTTVNPEMRPVWNGGMVTGTITAEPTDRSIFALLTGHASLPRPMLVSDKPAPGLQPSATPSPADIPNNHWAYAMQWFLFAGVAAIIYIIALRHRATLPEKPIL